MMGHWLDEAMTASGLRECTSYPRDLAEEAPFQLSVELVPIPRLTTAHVAEWTSKRKIRHSIADTNREIYGCMVAWKGSALLFHDTSDSEAEQRFTVAHEVAHFVLDHVIPRERALRYFGEGILPVLDGKRNASLEEKLSSVFGQVPLGVQVKLMDRNPSGHLASGAIAEAERRADRLALELLAPAELVRRILRSTPEEDGVLRVASRFGLPEDKARGYARSLLRQERAQRFSIIKFLGEDRS
ncbi:ImmA/IrrE family metallo-endopeptidase [Myxococcus sp. AM009]|uniref:ImmA/IrrE family metallo-endopeptidase n=1 Tax=Myxococcus sp. AM009 TaxID=2745137 RepID=UPI001595AFA1|nr:ImmA/IrrE family metallo-endopeptidase [Myxococcus sp. AM009]NVI97099.1 ImmA/IrrE family metallo-endopeptidase [Myxococcus sp. AM009]